MMIMQMLTMTWMVLHKMKNSRHEKYKKTFCLEFVLVVIGKSEGQDIPE